MADVSLLFNILARDSTAAGLNSASSRMDKFKARTSAAALGIMGAAAAAGTAMVKSAASQSSAIAAWTQVTGVQMDAQQQKIARSLNLSQTDYAKSYTTLSSLYQSNGLAQKQANEMAAKGLKLAADQAAFGNTTVGEAVEAQAGLLKGSGELLEKYAISITAADVAARMKADGTNKLTGAELKAATAQAKANLVMEQSAKFAGQAGREANSLESRQQRLGATVEDLKAKYGAKLLPVVEKVIGKFQSAADWVEQNQAKVRTLGIVVGVLAGIVITAAVGLKLYAATMMVVRAATMAWTGAMWLLNAAFLGNPVVGITVAVVALIAVIVLIATKTTWFQQIWAKAWGAIRGAAVATWNWIKSAAAAVFAALKGYVTALVGAYTGALQKVRGAFTAAWAAIKGGATAAASWLIGKARSIIDFYVSLPGRLGDLAGALVQHGKDFIQGFINGALETAKDIPGVMRDKVVGVAKSALHGFGLFGSPSRLTFRYGAWWVDGFVNGAKDRSKRLEETAKNMLDKFRAQVAKARQIRQEIRSAFSMDLSATEMAEGVKGPSLVERLSAQAAEAELFVKRIGQLRKAGLRENVLQQLIAAGPGSLGTATEALANVAGVNAAAQRIALAGTALGTSEAQRKTGIDLAGKNRATVNADGRKQTVVIDVRGADKELLALFRRIVRVEGAGSVQAALGKG